MIRRLYVDNFRSLVDFTWEPGKETLVLGYNGSGKTSALEVIVALRDLCTDSDRMLSFGIRAKDRTSWLDRPNIRIELDVEIQRRRYRYELVLGFRTEGWTDVVFERLLLDQKVLLVRDGVRVQLAPDEAETGPPFPVSIEKSVVAIVGAEFGGEDIVPFREALRNLLYFKPAPSILAYAPEMSVARAPNATFEDLVSWYRLLARDPEFVKAFTDDLREVWPELVGISTPEYSPGVFNLALDVQGGSSQGTLTRIGLQSLSDGERILIGLYTVAAFQRTHPPTTILIDEPDNFVSLLEVQPWLLRVLNDRPDDGQIILVSHNPEIIQTMGPERVAYFSRDDHLSPTRVSSLPPDETGLTLSELMARGWIDA